LDVIRRELGIPEPQFWEMTLQQVATMRYGAVVGAKWTRGEVRAILQEKDARAALEVLEYLYERGPKVVDWTDERMPCEDCQRLEGHSEACLERKEPAQ
jgi:hypothetical protein